MDRSPTKSALLGYGMLAAPLAFAGLPLYVYAPDFYATQFGVSLGAMGLVLLLVRCIDAVQDPLIGYVSDRFHARRLRVMVIAALLLVLGVAAVFHPLTHPLLWLAVSMVVATTAFSVLSINLNALGGLWSRDAHAKTRIAAVREVFTVVGLLVAVLLPAVLMQSMPASASFGVLSSVLALVTLVAVVVFVRWYRAHPVAQPAPVERVNVGLLWRVALVPHRRFWLVYGLSMLASSIPALLVIFFIRDRLEAEAYLGLFLALYFVSAALAMPLWSALSRRTGKAQAWLFGMALAVVSFVWVFALGAGDIVAYAVICVISGAAMAADLVLPPSMLADAIQEQTSESHASVQFAGMAFLSKLALAVSSAIALPVLAAFGYVPGGENCGVALGMLSVVYALIPCAIKAVAAGCLWRMMKINQGDDHAIHPSIDRSITDAE